MKNILLVAYSFIAALIGAGFASGQEILCYFAVFGRKGIWGIAVAAVIFALFIYAVLRICIKSKTYEYEEFTSILGGKYFVLCIRGISLFFCVTVFSAMISAFGEILCIFGIPQRLGSLVTALLCIPVLSRRADNILSFGGVLGMLLCAAIITVTVYMLRYREYHVFSGMIPVIENGTIYAGYNLVSLMPVLIVMSRRLNGRADAAAAAIIASISTTIMLMAMFMLISIYARKIPLGELPMMTLAARQNHTVAVIYGIILAASALTTLLSCGVSIVQTLNLRSNYLNSAGICAAGYFIAGIGFTELVGGAYKLFGIAGAAICIYVLKSCISKI